MPLGTQAEGVFWELLVSTHAKWQSRLRVDVLDGARYYWQSLRGVSRIAKRHLLALQLRSRSAWILFPRHTHGIVASHPRPDPRTQVLSSPAIDFIPRASLGSLGARASLGQKGCFKSRPAHCIAALHFHFVVSG